MKNKSQSESSWFSDGENNKKSENLSPIKRMPTEDNPPDSNIVIKKIEKVEVKKEEENLESKRRPIIPPPHPLLPKSQLPSEPIRTGAQIPFFKMTYTKGSSNYLVEKQWKQDKTEDVKELESGFYTKPKRSFKAMLGQELKGFERNPIVYSRYSKEPYDPNEEPTEDWFKSWIVNIKKLITETESSKLSLIGAKRKCKKEISKTKVVPYYTPFGNEDKTLVFESRFESGNLNLAIKMADNEYNLLLQNDINTNGHTQWFFFKVSNTFKGQSVKFNILNLCKPDSLYNYGMKVLCLSEQKKIIDGWEWFRDGTDIAYYKNNFRREGKYGLDKNYYTFTFTYKFPYNKDSVYFAYSLPYTYTDWTEDLDKIMADPTKATFWSRNTLWRTIAGNKWEYLTITSRESKVEDSGNKIEKKGVVISARVHPGESVGSWMMKGVLEFLTSDLIEAQALRKLYIFKVIPMLNPDGVINGNYRCSLSGGDLNRRWKAPSRTLHPTVYETKKLWRDFKKEREVTLFWDLHGHSRRKNIFMYGNNLSDDPSATRIFPFIMSKLTDYFSFKYSRFSMTKSKETTARISLFRELGIPCIYTMEASFWGADQGELKGLHFNTEHFNKIGGNLLHALILYCKIDPYEVITGKKQILELKDNSEEEKKEEPMELDQILNEFKDKEDELLAESDTGSSAGSDSEPSADNMSDEEIAKILPLKPKKKKQKKMPTQNSFKKRNRELEIRLKEKNRKREEMEKAK